VNFICSTIDFLQNLNEVERLGLIAWLYSILRRSIVSLCHYFVGAANLLYIFDDTEVNNTGCS